MKRVWVSLAALALMLPGRVHARPVGMQSATVVPAITQVVIGGVVLHACGDSQGYCGQLDRPLDPGGSVADRIRIAYRWFPHDGPGPSHGTIVTVQGGPGYGSIGSAPDFLAMTAPLRVSRDLLIMDNRGTGGSGALNCPALQASRAQRLPDVNACAAQLARTGHLYGTRLAVGDLLAILDRLHVGKVDLYGDSYGTFFGQVFAAAAPTRLRSLVLDGAYPARGGSPWYPELYAAIGRTFRTACARSPACAVQPGSFDTRLAALLARLRTDPPRGLATDSDGRVRNVTATASELFYVMANGGGGPTVYRDLDAAGRVLLDDNDAAPLLRLVAEAQVTGDGTDQSTAPTYYSKALFAAVSCSDYRQIYDLRAGFFTRRAQQAAAIAARRMIAPDTWSPFTFEEVRASPYQEDSVDLCLEWRWPASAPNPGQPIAPTQPLTSAPTLVISGGLDVVTTRAESREVARQFTNARFVDVENSFHVNALGDLNGCASAIFARFVRTLTPGDTTCGARIAPARGLRRFARTAAALDPATPLPGNAGTDADLRLASAVAETAGDAVVRWWINLSGSATALRGGTYTYTYPDATTTVIALDHARWVEDVAVSGTVTWNEAAHTVVADLSTEEDGQSGMWRLSWRDGPADARATIRGTLGARKIVAERTAP